MLDEIAARDVKVGLPLRLSVGRENVYVIRGCLWSNRALGEIDAVCHSFFEGILIRNQMFFVRILHNSCLAHIVHDVMLSHNIIIKI